MRKLVSANSPSDFPNPVKSKRITAIPASARAGGTRAAAAESEEQVKHCAKTAVAGTLPAGSSTLPTSSWPAPRVNLTRSRRAASCSPSVLCVVAP